MTTPKAHQIDYSQFLYFHPSVAGKVGKPVFIDPKLIVRFVELIDVSNESGVTLAKKIVARLSAVAGGITSDSNTSNAGQHRDHFMEAQVFVTYTILQADAANKGSGIYITDIEQAVKSEKGGGPGFYRAAFSHSQNTDWSPSESLDPKLNTAIGAIGAINPDHNGQTAVAKTADIFGKYLVKKDGKKIVNEYSLFYTPSYTIDHYGIWIGAEQKINTEKGSPQALANLWQNTEKQHWDQTDQRYRWYAFGHGAKQVLAALKLCNNEPTQTLGRHHEFVFVDPKIPLGELKHALGKVGITLSQEMIKLENPDLGSKVHFAIDANSTYSSLHAANFQNYGKLSAMETAAKQHYDKRNQNVYFVDIIKDLASTVKDGWV